MFEVGFRSNAGSGNVVSSLLDTVWQTLQGAAERVPFSQWSDSDMADKSRQTFHVIMGAVALVYCVLFAGYLVGKDLAKRENRVSEATAARG